MRSDYNFYFIQNKKGTVIYSFVSFKQSYGFNSISLFKFK